MKERKLNMIYTLTINCIWGMYLQEPCRRVIEMDETDTLYGLHSAIQKAVKFDDDHPFEFYAARTERSRPRYPIGSEAVEMALGACLSPRQIRSEMASIAGFRFGQPPASQTEGIAWAARLATMDDPALHEIFPLPKRLNLYYWFDFGDDWKFEIKKARHAKPKVPRVKYPRVIGRVGPNPVQYPNVEAW
jgi:hypothetical protein